MSAEEIARLPYRPCVGIVLLNAENRVFVAKRIDASKDNPHAWQMPQGGIDKGEDPERAALRELHEEIGTDKVAVIGESQSWLRYDFPPELVEKVRHGRYRGQEQRWFAMRFLGKDSDIDLDTEHPEFSDWRWENLENLPALTITFKRDLYTAIVQEFRHLVA
ncbi:RNA pyrophosphohydrolase [Pelagibius litoralis]|uniref:RNA pyrophosphohydrolase n=1 Tax=Pelagibius litoralis TaxID=374515 RepID=A0A967EV84_9PROT|nr:RNA pyrophosphohydrolase [Pelagibius litoralis]